MKYDFGTQNVASGYIKVAPDAAYSEETGYGLNPTTPVSVQVTDAIPLLGDYVYAEDSFCFQHKLVPGNYQIKVTCAAPTEQSVLVAAQDIMTKQPQSEGFFHNAIVKGAVRIKGTGTLVFEVAVIDELFELEFRGNPFDYRHFKAMVNAVEINPIAANKQIERPTIWLAGDSTVQGYSADDIQAGWGQMLGGFVGESTLVANRGIGGRSTRSFYRDGRLEEILLNIKPGDYCLMQFGHNDGSTAKEERYTHPDDYERLLRDYYVRGVVQRQATPVIVTPVPRHGLASGVGHLEYVKRAQQVAADTGAAIIDVHAAALAHYNNLAGSEKEKLQQIDEYYITTKKGGSDYTHFTKAGAKKMAELVYQELQHIL